MKVGLGIDEWFREESPSRIKKLTILQKGNTWPPGDQLRSEHIGKIDCGLNIAGGNLKITLQKDEDATIISEFEECYPRHGYFHMLIKYPTSGARITVDCPDDIGMYLHFAHKERETLKGGNDYVCPFTLLPDQHVGIRFWDKQQNEKWKREPVTL